MATSYCYSVIRPPKYEASFPLRYGIVEENLTEAELCDRIARNELQQPFNPRNVHIVNLIVDGINVENLES